MIDAHDRTARVVSEAAGTLAEALPRIDNHGETLDQLRGRVEALSEELAARPNVAAVCWPTLTADEADEIWQALAAWVSDVLGPFYRITRGELPDCWTRHPDAVVELVWLHTCWREAYEGGRGRPGAAAEWHTRWRPATLTAIAQAIPTGRCRPGEHEVPIRESDAARSEARDARAMAGGQRTGGGYGPAGYQPPPAAPAPDTVEDGPRRYDPQAEQVTSPQHWGAHYEQGKADDLAWRRDRDSARPGPAQSPG
ncbi:hypothetical protein [Pseudonocardia sp. ICBG162]|uniref:hypothetical protein n=1 Tax=Pseudonocardia sp. ICBG162 TaxID=2846761 RepID=UPI001CF6DA7E|nr:hypothetical protein [Pseudonocardia sp. ICBG162]